MKLKDPIERIRELKREIQNLEELKKETEKISKQLFSKYINNEITYDEYIKEQKLRFNGKTKEEAILNYDNKIKEYKKELSSLKRSLEKKRAKQRTYSMITLSIFIIIMLPLIFQTDYNNNLVGMFAIEPQSTLNDSNATTELIVTETPLEEQKEEHEEISEETEEQREILVDQTPSQQEKNETKEETQSELESNETISIGDEGLINQTKETVEQNQTDQLTQINESFTNQTQDISNKTQESLNETLTNQTQVNQTEQTVNLTEENITEESQIINQTNLSLEENITENLTENITENITQNITLKNITNISVENITNITLENQTEQIINLTEENLTEETQTINQTETNLTNETKITNETINDKETINETISSKENITEEYIDLETHSIIFQEIDNQTVEANKTTNINLIQFLEIIPVPFQGFIGYINQTNLENQTINLEEIIFDQEENRSNEQLYLNQTSENKISETNVNDTLINETKNKTNQTTEETINRLIEEEKTLKIKRSELTFLMINYDGLSAYINDNILFINHNETGMYRLKILASYNQSIITESNIFYVNVTPESRTEANLTTNQSEQINETAANKPIENLKYGEFIQIQNFDNYSLIYNQTLFLNLDEFFYLQKEQENTTQQDPNEITLLENQDQLEVIHSIIYNQTLLNASIQIRNQTNFLILTPRYNLFQNTTLKLITSNLNKTITNEINITLMPNETFPIQNLTEILIEEENQSVVNLTNTPPKIIVNDTEMLNLNITINQTKRIDLYNYFYDEEDSLMFLSIAQEPLVSFTDSRYLTFYTEKSFSDIIKLRVIASDSRNITEISLNITYLETEYSELINQTTNQTLLNQTNLTAELNLTDELNQTSLNETLNETINETTENKTNLTGLIIPETTSQVKIGEPTLWKKQISVKNGEKNWGQKTIVLQISEYAENISVYSNSEKLLLNPDLKIPVYNPNEQNLINLNEDLTNEETLENSEENNDSNINESLEYLNISLSNQTGIFNITATNTTSNNTQDQQDNTENQDNNSNISLEDLQDLHDSLILNNSVENNTNNIFNQEGEDNEELRIDNTSNITNSLLEANPKTIIRTIDNNNYFERSFSDKILADLIVDNLTNLSISEEETTDLDNQLTTRNEAEQNNAEINSFTDDTFEKSTITNNTITNNGFTNNNESESISTIDVNTTDVNINDTNLNDINVENVNSSINTNTTEKQDSEEINEDELDINNTAILNQTNIEINITQNQENESDSTVMNGYNIIDDPLLGRIIVISDYFNAYETKDFVIEYYTKGISLESNYSFQTNLTGYSDYYFKNLDNITYYNVSYSITNPISEELEVRSIKNISYRKYASGNYETINILLSEIKPYESFSFSVYSIYSRFDVKLYTIENNTWKFDFITEFNGVLEYSINEFINDSNVELISYECIQENNAIQFIEQNQIDNTNANDRNDSEVINPETADTNMSDNDILQSDANDSIILNNNLTNLTNFDELNESYIKETHFENETQNQSLIESENTSEITTNNNTHVSSNSLDSEELNENLNNEKDKANVEDNLIEDSLIEDNSIEDNSIEESDLNFYNDVGTLVDSQNFVDSVSLVDENHSENVSSNNLTNQSNFSQNIEQNLTNETKNSSIIQNITLESNTSMENNVSIQNILSETSLYNDSVKSLESNRVLINNCSIMRFNFRTNTKEFDVDLEFMNSSLKVHPVEEKRIDIHSGKVTGNCYGCAEEKVSNVQYACVKTNVADSGSDFVIQLDLNLSDIDRFFAYELEVCLDTIYSTSAQNVYVVIVNENETVDSNQVSNYTSYSSSIDTNQTNNNSEDLRIDNETNQSLNELDEENPRIYENVFNEMNNSNETDEDVDVFNSTNVSNPTQENIDSLSTLNITTNNTENVSNLFVDPNLSSDQIIGFNSSFDLGINNDSFYSHDSLFYDEHYEPKSVPGFVDVGNIVSLTDWLSNKNSFVIKVDSKVDEFRNKTQVCGLGKNIQISPDTKILIVGEEMKNKDIPFACFSLVDNSYVRILY